MNIQIYTDNVSANHILYYALTRLYGKNSVCFINANEILSGVLSKDVDLFVMPGGASRYKADKLNGKANHIIKAYVEQGGRYFGICGGAYMGCNVTKWAQGLPHEIIVHNELNFFSGAAIGPVEAFGRGDNYNQTDAHLVTLEYQGKLVESLYLGGCVFQPDAKDSYEVLASFSDLPDKPAAIVSGRYGQGRWLLCSTHPEYDNEAVELLDFNVIGNQYEHFSRLPNDADLRLELLESLLVNLDLPSC
ncbi:BPL-N domain-containing protein [Marinomonas colpomeniae]|uniref:Biotin--protein ligase n=1 Tax=Marinomonas colpomeniae TaxID=2774408 RepID=A0ABR8NXX9_9GAMM|nr:BPL-N domain-containing protein [Marinomonas colpomeniae]MBD5770886.1 biotin--protein ligase [Marinomonas colpomeniae]